jgi:hypothetical protein
VPAPNLSNQGAETPAPEAETPADLGREIRLLERARRLIDSNPALALDTLLEHERAFGNGTLVLERKFLEVQALWRLGRRAEARMRANALRANAPGSLYERRLSQLLGESQDSTAAATGKPGAQ